MSIAQQQEALAKRIRDGGFPIAKESITFDNFVSSLFTMFPGATRALQHCTAQETLYVHNGRTVGIWSVEHRMGALGVPDAWLPIFTGQRQPQ